MHHILLMHTTTYYNYLSRYKTQASTSDVFLMPKVAANKNVTAAADSASKFILISIQTQNNGSKYILK